MTPSRCLAVIFACLITAACGSGGDAGDNQEENSPSDPLPVQPAPAPVPTLKWAAPTTRTDHSLLPSWEIDKYQIWYGKDRLNLSLLAEVPGGADTPELSLEQLADGYYYFAITVVDSDALVSDMSALLLRKLPDDFIVAAE